MMSVLGLLAEALQSTVRSAVESTGHGTVVEIGESAMLDPSAPKRRR
jgi:hypothetical protein